MKKLIVLTVLFSFVAFSQQATPLQYLYVMKSFKPQAQKVGILCELSKYQGLVDKLQRAGFSAGVKIIIGDIKELKDVSQRFEELIKKGIDFLWIIDEKDISASQIVREYILKNALLNLVPVAVPDAEFVKEGGLFSIETSGDEVTIYVNNKVVNALKLSIPENYKERVHYVVN